MAATPIALILARIRTLLVHLDLTRIRRHLDRRLFILSAPVEHVPRLAPAVCVL